MNRSRADGSEWSARTGRIATDCRVFEQRPAAESRPAVRGASAAPFLRPRLLVAALALLVLAACGGGGGDSEDDGACAETSRPLQVLAADTSFDVGDAVDIEVRSLGADCAPLGGVEVAIQAPAGLVVEPDTVTTGTDGRGRAVLRGIAAGAYRILATADVPGTGPVSATLAVTVRGPISTFTPTPAPGQATRTPTLLPASAVRTIILEAEPFAITSGGGGVITVRAFAFDVDNAPVNGAAVLFDFSPKVGVLRPLTDTTRTLDGIDGVAETRITIAPRTAPPGAVSVTARAGAASGQVTFRIVSGDG